MFNLEIYGGPADGELMDIDVLDDVTPTEKRKMIHGALYAISSVNHHPDKNLCLGVHFVGVHVAKRK